MDFELNLLENSYDYLNESLNYYKEIGYDETHDPAVNSIEEKKKWKTTFVLLVQAVELLLKEKLARVNPIFIYDNIDGDITNNAKTISFRKSLTRLVNINPKLLNIKEQVLLIKCGNIRNDCIHYKVKLNSIDIKNKYCKLFELYKVLHSRFFNKKYYNATYKFQIIQILQYAKGFKVFRGNEFTPTELKIMQREIKDAQNKCYVYNSSESLLRIKFGDEPNFLNNKFGTNLYNDFSAFQNLNYCGDCLAARGEFHGLLCDWEICPKCGQQLISCNCFDDYCYPNRTHKKSLLK